MAAPNIVTVQSSTFNHMLTLQVQLAPGATTANTTAEQSFTVQGLLADNAALGIEGDQILSVTKPTFQAGIAIVGARVIADNTLRITWGNWTATPTQPSNELYNVNIWRPNASVSTAVGTAI